MSMSTVLSGMLPFMALSYPPMLTPSAEQDGAGDGRRGWIGHAGVHVRRAGGGAFWLGHGEKFVS